MEPASNTKSEDQKRPAQTISAVLAAESAALGLSDAVIDAGVPNRRAEKIASFGPESLTIISASAKAEARTGTIDDKFLRFAFG